jgi:formyltetrahydrofolate deformylase
MDWRITTPATSSAWRSSFPGSTTRLQELLWRSHARDLGGRHPPDRVQPPRLGTAREDVRDPVPPRPERPGERERSEAVLLDLVRDEVDVIVLARYMQILTPQFLRAFGGPIINIHHSFLPAFVGADPYRAAFERGVKLIGATAHYVTDELDAGPIIDQDVHRVDHAHSIEDLRRVGRLVERNVLARAVAWHLDDRVLVHANKTIVFPGP